MNTFVFLIVSMALFLLQLSVVMMIFYLCSILILWPIKGLYNRMKALIKRGQY